MLLLLLLFLISCLSITKNEDEIFQYDKSKLKCRQKMDKKEKDEEN